jgi:hypothetical protein
MFATKPQLASALLDRAHSAGIRAAFVAGDEVYGWSCGVAAVAAARAAPPGRLKTYKTYREFSQTRSGTRQASAEVCCPA